MHRSRLLHIMLVLHLLFQRSRKFAPARQHVHSLSHLYNTKASLMYRLCLPVLASGMCILVRGTLSVSFHGATQMLSFLRTLLYKPGLAPLCD